MQYLRQPDMALLFGAIEKRIEEYGISRSEFERRVEYIMPCKENLPKRISLGLLMKMCKILHYDFIQQFCYVRFIAMQVLDTSALADDETAVCDNICKFIAALVLSGDETRTTLAQKINCSRPTLNRIINNKNPRITVDIIIRLSYCLNEDLIKRFVYRQ
jgi:DNA-binding Xre family transcriptional regulator